MEPGRLELYPYNTIIESTKEKDVVLAQVLWKNKGVALCDTNIEVKGQDLLHLTSLVSLWKLDAV